MLMHLRKIKGNLGINLDRRLRWEKHIKTKKKTAQPKSETNVCT
jgi:hypothetical protein